MISMDFTNIAMLRTVGNRRKISQALQVLLSSLHSEMFLYLTQLPLLETLHHSEDAHSWMWHRKQSVCSRVHDIKSLTVCTGAGTWVSWKQRHAAILTELCNFTTHARLLHHHSPFAGWLPDMHNVAGIGVLAHSKKDAAAWWDGTLHLQADELFAHHITHTHTSSMTRLKLASEV